MSVVFLEVFRSQLHAFTKYKLHFSQRLVIVQYRGNFQTSLDELMAFSVLKHYEL